MKDNPFDNEDFRAWVEDRRKRLIPNMRDSASVLMIAPDMNTKFDIEFALQIGSCILLEKPLILLVHPGRTIPPKLLAIADRIIEGDIDSESESMREQIKQAMTELGKQ